MMQTKILSPHQVDIAANLIRQGQCVAFPTETVYGLGANALDKQAVARIFAAKGRPADNPLIIHCHSIAQVEQFVQPWPQRVQDLMNRFWPGPLTLVLPKRPIVPSIITGGLDTVAVRIPNHPVALGLIRRAQLPIAAPSANISGKPSPTRAEHVLQDMEGRISAIVDGGATGWGVESTVLDCTILPFRLLRPGGITLEQLHAVAEVEVDPGSQGETERPRSPGMKYRHYSPTARVILVVGEKPQVTMRDQIQRHGDQGPVAVMTFSEYRQEFPDAYILDMGSQEDLNQAAARIFHLLRQADQRGFTTIIVQGLPDAHLGLAIMNRLRRAADQIIEI